MSRFLDALAQAEQARKDRAQKPEPRPETRVNGIGGAAAYALHDQLPSALGSQLSASSEHSAEKKTGVEERRRQVQRSKTPSALGSQLSTLDERLVSLVAPTSFEADQYRTLRHVVEQKRNEANVHVIAITSPAIGDGKTLTSINLAGALGQAPDARVLLIDADLRRPSIRHQLGIDKAQRTGLVDFVLNKSINFSDIVVRFPDFNLSVIFSGPAPSPPYEVLKSPRIGELLCEARSHFDFIVIDTPPLVPFPDCRVISKWVDGFLVVMSAHKTPQAQFEEGTSALDPGKIIGIVFNTDDALAPARYNYYYKYQRGARRGWNLFGRRRG